MANERVVTSLNFGVPARTLLGNLADGTGPARYLTLEELAQAVASTGVVATPGAPANLGTIATARVLGNTSGANAAPTAQALTQPAAGLTITSGSNAFTFALADDLAALEAMAGTGLVARTAANTYAQRTLTPPAAGITISNGDGVAGNPTLALANDLAAVEGLAGTGLAIRTGESTWTNRFVAVGSAKLTISNGDGVAGNPTVDFGSVAAADLSNGVTGSGLIVLQTGPTVSGATLSGTTTLTGSGQISSAGEIGLGNSPLARLHLRGTYTTANDAIIKVDGTFASSNTTNQLVGNYSPTITPTGASITTVQNYFSQPSLSNSALNVARIVGIAQGFTIAADYSGTISDVNMLRLSDITWSNGSFSALFSHVFSRSITNGNGATSGSVTNSQFQFETITAGSAGATINNYAINMRMPQGGATSGTTNNRGIYITGNGGTAAGGTVNNFALFSDSTAPVQIGGVFQFLGATSAFPMLKRSSTVLEHRLADDSAYGPVAASEARQYGGENGQFLNVKSLTELTTIAAAATTDTTIQIPANAIVIAVSTRVTVAIPTAATFDIGIAGATTRYGTGISTAANTTSKGTLDALRYYAAATAIRITPNLTPAANTGRVRVTIHYIEVTPPTS